MRDRLRRRLQKLRDQRGSMLIELIVSLTFLAVAVGALISLYASTVVDLRHASIEGNALTLADKQMEKVKTYAYSNIALNSTTLPGGSDLYVTSPPSNLTATQKSSITGGQLGGGTFPATQTITGPDNRTYRVDTYIFNPTPASGYSPYLQVTVAVRLVTAGTVGSIRAQSSSAINSASTLAPS